MQRIALRGLIMAVVVGLATGCSDTPADLANKACQAGQRYADDEIGLEALLAEGETIGQRAREADISRTSLGKAMERHCGGLAEAIRLTLLGGYGATSRSLAGEVCLRSRRYQEGDITADAYAEARQDVGAKARLADISISDLREAVTSQCAAVTVSTVLDAAEQRARDDGAETTDSDDTAQSDNEAAPKPASSEREEDSGVATTRLQSCPKIEPDGDFRVDAVGVYEGAGRASVSQSESNDSPGRVDVTVNRPDEPVVLVLSAYEPVVWAVESTPETELVGVIVSGYHTQKVTGVSEATPLRATSYKGPGHCDEPFQAYEEGRGFQEANGVVANLLGHKIDTFNGAYRAERFVIGAATNHVAGSQEPSNEAPRPSVEPKPVKAGEAGIKQLRQRGALRPARAAELERWASLVRAAQDLSEKELPAPEHKRFRRIYTVTRHIKYPKGLHGAHAVRFLIPEGVPEPLADPGHSTVYDMNTASCRGTGCPALGQ